MLKALLPSVDIHHEGKDARNESGPSAQVIEQGLPSDQVSESIIQPQPFGEDLPSRPKLDPPNTEKPQFALSNLSRLETEAARRRAPKRNRR